MPWFRLDDEGAFHAKVLDAGNEAYGAWVRAGQWCSQRRTDGFIPFATAHTIAPAKIWKRLEAAKGTSIVGLIEAIEPSLGGYQIHDFVVYNPTSEETDDRRKQISEKRAEAGRASAKRRAEIRAKTQQPTEQSVQQTVNKTRFVDQQNPTNSEQPGNTNPTPIPIPIPSSPQGPPTGEEQAKRDPDATYPPGLRPIARAEPILSIGAGSYEAIEIFKATLTEVRGEGYILVRPGSAASIIVDVVNVHCRGTGPTQTTKGALTEFERLVRKWHAAKREDPQYTGGWKPEAFAAWLNEGWAFAGPSPARSTAPGSAVHKPLTTFASVGGKS